MGYFQADADKLEQLYLEHADAMFLLAYVHASIPQNATAVIGDALQDIASHEKSWHQARGGQHGLLFLLHESCMEYQRKKPRKKVKAEALKKMNVPFVMTDLLIAILHLPVECKSPLVLCQGLGLSPAAAAGILRKSESAVSRHLTSAAARLEGVGSWNEVRRTLQSIRVDRQTHQRIFDKLALAMSEKGFGGKQRLKRFKRGMDDAIPFIALGVIALCVCAYLGVHFGWFGGSPYTPSVDPLLPSQISTAPVSADPLQPEDGRLRYVYVYVPAGDGLTQYEVRNTPNTAQTLVALMVSLGALPAGTELDSAVFPVNGEKSCVITLSVEAAAIADDPAGRRLLHGMALTFDDFYGPFGKFGALEDISVLCGGMELTADGMTAQALRHEAIAIADTIEIEYRE